MSATTIPVSIETFRDAVLNSEKPVLVDFWADWCGPCRRLAPTLAQLSDEESDRLVVATVNVDEEPELSERYSISAFPTLALFVNGRLVHRSVGADPKWLILDEFADYL